MCAAIQSIALSSIRMQPCERAEPKWVVEAGTVASVNRDPPRAAAEIGEHV